MTDLHQASPYKIPNFQADLFDAHRRNPERYPFLLESVSSVDEQTPFSFLFAYPQQWLVQYGDGRLELDGTVFEADSFLAALDQLHGHSAVDSKRDTSIPFSGGWFVFMSYELAGDIEPRLNLPMSDQDPVAYAARIPVAAVLNHKTGTVSLVAESGFELELETLKKDLLINPVSKPPNEVVDLSSSEDESNRYLEGVNKIKQYIHDGDVFQVNLSRQWRVKNAKSSDLQTIYQRLREVNPAPFAAYAQFNEYTICSSSPERLVRVGSDRVVETRPIAGTRPRGDDLNTDAALSSELLAHPKEQAEHIMLIDLERNDLGRVCSPGSVEVNELMVLESYAHVHHIVSNIRGRLRDGVTPGQVLAAVFPGGTITGCPKVRCMEIIAELEQQPRGAYTGSVGYINHDGSMDFNILIRTLAFDGEELVIQAGAGIVADSDPQHELEETRAKARGMLLALGGRA